MKKFSQKEDLINLINNLSDKEVEYTIQSLKAKSIIKKDEANKIIKLTSTEKYLNKLDYNIPKNKQIGSLANLFHKEWKIIYENKIITKHFIKHLDAYNNDQGGKLIAFRRNKDSSAGSYFENLFGNFLLAYFYSKDELIKKNKLLLNVIINDSVIVPGERKKKQPDITVTDLKNDIPICVVELKKAYTHRSLKKEYDRQNNYWRKLNKNILFLYVIFDASKSKAKTYKTVPYCRVICNDFKLLDSKKIPTTILDPIEKIFDEIFRNVFKRLKS